jgi:hypothetical protein
MKTRRSKRQKGSGFSKSRKNIKNSLDACAYTNTLDPNIIWDKNIHIGSCESAVRKYDVQAFPIRDNKGNKIPGKKRLEFNEFFKSPSFKPNFNLTSRFINGRFEYSCDGKIINDDKVDRYKEIGSRILWYTDTTIKPTPGYPAPGCYVLRDTPLTMEEVISKTPTQLNAMLSTLPCITDETVNGWYQTGQQLYNPDYNPLSQQAPSPQMQPIQPMQQSLPPRQPMQQSFPPRQPIQPMQQSFPPRQPIQPMQQSFPPRQPIQPMQQSLPPRQSIQPMQQSLPPRQPIQPMQQSFPPRQPIQTSNRV